MRLRHSYFKIPCKKNFDLSQILSVNISSRFTKRAWLNTHATLQPPRWPAPFWGTRPRAGKTTTTSVLTAAALTYACGAGITAAAGTRLALHLFLAFFSSHISFQLKNCYSVSHCYWCSLPRDFHIGQFARLLPSLEVVAISHAPSPESNPNSLYALSSI